jgi:hypothetical protein
MFSAIIVNDSKPNEEPMCLQGDVVFVVSSKKVEKHYENEGTMAIDLEKPWDKNIYLNLGTSIRTMIDQEFSENKEARGRAMFEFIQGFCKRGGTTEILEVKKRRGTSIWEKVI